MQLSTSKTPVAKERQKLLKKMTSDLQKAATELENMDRKTCVGVLKFAWKKGALISHIHEKTAEYGTNAIAQLAAYRGESPSHLYDLRNLCLTWTWDEIEHIGREPMANGQPLTVAHLLHVGHLESHKERKKLLERAKAQCSSAKDLSNEIRGQMVREKRKKGVGRKPARPTSPMAGVQQIRNQSLSLNRKMPSWKEAVFDELDQVSADKFNPTLHDDLVETEKELKALNENCKKMLYRVKKVLGRSKKILNEKKE